MSTPALVALNVLNILTGGETIVAKHAAPEKKTEKNTDKGTVTRLYGGVVIVSTK